MRIEKERNMKNTKKKIAITIAIVTVLALRQQIVPPTAHLDALDPACAGVEHLTQASARPLRAALSNSFAFGGSNAVLALRAAS